MSQNTNSRGKSINGNQLVLLYRASNGDAVVHWKYQPTVYLAILTAISNKALAFAAVQGTVVTFWTRALQGTTLAQMHRDWSYGLHVVRLPRSFCNLRNVG